MSGRNYNGAPSSGVMTRGGSSGIPTRAIKRWNGNSKVGKFLLEAMMSGEIDINDLPNVVHKKYDVFHDYTAQQFRNAFNSMKKTVLERKRSNGVGAPPPLLGTNISSGGHIDDEAEGKYLYILLFYSKYHNCF